MSHQDADLIDDDGYPTDTALAAIQNWTGTPQVLVDEILDPIFARGAGAHTETATDFANRPVMRVSLVTGGWSGCETAIGVIERSMFGFAYWESSSRGGLHTYTVPLDDYVRPMLVLPDLRPLLPLDARTVLAALMTAMNCNMNDDTSECPSCDTGTCTPHDTYYYCHMHDAHERDNAKDTCGYALMLTQHALHASRRLPARATA